MDYLPHVTYEDAIDHVDKLSDEVLRGACRMASGYIYRSVAPPEDFEIERFVILQEHPEACTYPEELEDLYTKLEGFKVTKFLEGLVYSNKTPLTLLADFMQWVKDMHALEVTFAASLMIPELISPGKIAWHLKVFTPDGITFTKLLRPLPLNLNGLSATLWHRSRGPNKGGGSLVEDDLTPALLELIKNPYISTPEDIRGVLRHAEDL